MESLKERFIKYLIEYKKLKEEDLRNIAKDSPAFNDFRSNLIKHNLVKEEDILIALSREYRMPYLDLDKYRLNKENKNLISQDIAFRYKVLPISKIGDVLTLATSNPLDVIAMDDLRMTTSFKRIDLVLAREDKIMRSLHDLYTEANITSFIDEHKEEGDVSVEVRGADEGKGLESLVKESKLPPIVRVVDLVVYEALRRGASDIHIEPTESGLDVRYRIDGVLHKGLSLPRKNENAVLARLKIMSSLNITEFRVPQDGRFKVKFQGRQIDFRVSSLPTQFGEKIVLRILDRESLSAGVKKLGFSEQPLKLFERALESPFGIILVTGPTGSGKSTTLYSIINQLNTPQRSIITIEDPVEYQIEGITQIQARPDIGLSFASALRSVLRQSPDIIMVGEIRDAETADIAIKASLTGELIFSTLHTNNSVGAITRLIDMGIEPFLVSSSLISATAQRLVRKLCLKCKVKEKPDNVLLKRLGINVKLKELFHPKGCSYCHNTGYRGRTALLEILLFDDTIREMVAKRSSEEEIIEYAKKKKIFLSLKEDGLTKIIDGVTSLEEVLRVAG
ncbi:MAG: hypothetical protein B1H08_06005 [Candidatus Omnitrophica bacterium 4484_171]|nr:MAG: hypothetical protein B1H08_06005 [Candidatus Omnitrophica bacterium 4484_171]